MTFSANHAPFKFSELRTVFSLTAAGTVNLGLPAIRNMRSATATAAVGTTISMSSLRGRAVVNVTVGGTPFLNGGYVRSSYGAINDTRIFGKEIKAFYFDGGGGNNAPFLFLSGSASSGFLSTLYSPSGTSYSSQAPVLVAVNTANDETIFRFQGLFFTTAGAVVTCYFDD